MRGKSNLGDLFFDLSVNFLLYCALIIVFYLLITFYLEEETTIHVKRGYEVLNTVEVDEDNEDSEENNVSKTSGNDEYSSLPTPPPSVQMKPSNVKELNAHIVIEESISQEIFKQVVICALGLIVSFSIWGLVQERILTQPYSNDYFEYSYGLVFLNRLGGLILSFILMWYLKINWVRTPLWEFSFPSVANMLSSWCQYEALKYVSFPTQMLAKAFKILPVMLMGKFLHGKTYESHEYVAAGMIGFGLYLFIDSSEHVDFQKNLSGSPDDISGATCGVVLLLLFLFFDSFTGQFQAHMFKINKSMSALQMMTLMNLFSTVFSFVTLIHQEELYVSLVFFYEHTEIIAHLLIFCICSTVGQLFIFHTVKSFGPVVFSIIMSSRILFSTLLSCFVYYHPITEMGVVGIIIVFGAIAYRIQQQLADKPLFVWKDNNEGHNTVVLHEIHEHLDI